MADVNITVTDVNLFDAETSPPTGNGPKIPSIPVFSNDPSSLRIALDKVKETIDIREGRIGSKFDKYITWRDLFQSGITQVTLNGISYRTNNNSPFVAVATDTVSYAPPPAPTGFTATGGFTLIQLQWTDPKTLYSNHSYTEVWRNTANNLGTAVMLGTSSGRFYVDSVGNAVTYYYWIRFVSTADVKGPYNATNGTAATSAQDPAYLLSLLNGQITTSQLYSTLATRINLIDADSTVAGSVAYRDAQTLLSAATNAQNYVGSYAYTKSQTDANITSAGTVLTSAYQAADAATLSSAQGYIQNYAYSKSTVDGNITSAGQVLTSAYQAADAATLSSAQGYVQNYAYSKSTVDGNISAAGTTITSNYQTADAGVLSGAKTYAEGYVQSYAYSKTGADTAISTSFNQVSARLNSGGDTYQSIVTAQNTATAKSANFVQASTPTATKVGDLWIDTSSGNVLKQWSGSAWVAADDIRIGASATSITQLSSRLNDAGGGVSMEQKFSTNASQISGLQGEYTVKIDTNGYVTGFGLSSTANTATPTSAFIVRADSFSVANPSGPGITPAIPFVVRTTSTTINGVSVPVGVYLTDAFIANGTISNAKIGDAAIDNAKIANLDAAKITSGFISADRIQAGTLDAKIANIDAAVIGSGTITNARIGNLDASKITTGSLSADRIDSRNLTIKDAYGNVIFGAGTTLDTPYITVGAVSTAQSAGYLGSSVVTPYNYSGGSTVNISTGTLISLTTTGAPVTVWVTVFGNAVSWNTSVAYYQVTVILGQDGSSTTWPNNSQPVLNQVTIPATRGSQPEGYYCIPIVYRVTPSNGTHTFSLTVSIDSIDSSGNRVSFSGGIYGYAYNWSSIVAMENKL
jgi:hypothetical protein